MITDVLMCVGPADIEYLFLHSLTSCVRNLHTLREVFIVTPNRSKVLGYLKDAGKPPVPIKILEDHEVLSPSVAALPGWCQQQAIKLAADQICSTQYVACLGADTILLREVDEAALFVNETPILYYTEHLNERPHLQYERTRVRNVANLLGVDPVRSLPIGDFIMDLMVFDTTILTLLRSYLQALYGNEPMLKVLPAHCSTLEEKSVFGEWSLYAVFLLDVLQHSPPLRKSGNHLVQVHSQKDLQQFDFDARIVHFVDKGFDRSYLLNKLLEHNLDGCFP